MPGMSNNFGKCLLLRTLTSISICYLDSHLDWSFPLCDFFPPSLIIFSASYITLLTLGVWPRRRKKHTLLLILQCLWCLLTLLVISQEQEHGVTKKCFLPDRTKWRNIQNCLFSLAERKRHESPAICWSFKTASPGGGVRGLRLQSTSPSLMRGTKAALAGETWRRC